MQFQRFEEFWRYYLREHSHRGTRALHFLGTTIAVGCVAAAIVTRLWWLLAVAPVAGYGFAWIGHFLVERNRPATFGKPLWSFAADFKMYGLLLTGRLGKELRRLGIE